MLGNFLNRLALSFAFAGLGISSALTLSHATRFPLPCGGSGGCEKVAQDASSSVLGVPISVFGFGLYLLIATITALKIWNEKRVGLSNRFQNLNSIGLVLSALGMMVSIWLTYHSITSIHATCAWCLASLAMLTSLTVTYALLATCKVRYAESQMSSAAAYAVVPLLAISSIYFGLPHSPPAFQQVSVIAQLDNVNLEKICMSGHILGDPKTRIVIAEFGDLLCPACRDMHARILRFHERFLDKVSIVFNHFPLSKEAGHELSRPAALMSQKLNNKDFWIFVSKVYESNEKPTKEDLDSLYAAMPSKDSIDAKKADSELQRQILLGESYGVKQTPTYILFIDRKPVATATSTDIAQVLSQPEFKAILAPSESH